MNGLNSTIVDIGRGIFRKPTQGPHSWDKILPEDFGPRWDYELENHITKWIVTPVSNAALEWCYAHLPADIPRWGATGFVIEAMYLNAVVKAMIRDKLMSPEEYDAAQQELKSTQEMEALYQEEEDGN